MSNEGPKKRKSKSWYRRQAFQNKRMKADGTPGHRLTAGLKGFIVTCNDREKDAVKESYNILNEYADKLYGPEAQEEAECSEHSDGDDIEENIAREVQTLKDSKAAGQHRFQNSQTGAKNCIFIKTSLDDPAGLAHAIFTDLLQTKVQKSRYALRLLPVVGTCKANLKDLTELAKDVLKPFFTETKYEVTFTITFKARNNNGLGREMTISTLRNTVMEMFPSVLLHYTPINPQLTILVEVMCGVACIAVAREFTRFRKYNLVEVVHEKQTPVVTNQHAKDSSQHVASEKMVDEGEKEKETPCPQQGGLPDTSTKPDSCSVDQQGGISDTSTKPDSCSVDQQGGISDTSTKPDSCSVDQQGGLPDTSTKPDSCSVDQQGGISDTSTKPDSCSVDQQGGISDTSTKPDSCSVDQQGGISDTSTKPDSCSVDQQGGISDTSTKPDNCSVDQ